MKEQKKFGVVALAIALISIAIIWAVGLGEATEEIRGTPEEEGASIYNYVKLLDKVAFFINQRYVDSVDVRDMTLAGIRGMIETLDPFSSLQDAKAHDRLMEMTEGKYEGLGMTIAKRGDWITVISPIEGTPAYRMGIRAGDKIVKIDDKSAKGMSSEEAAKLMRGERGTTVLLTIKREGVEELLEYEVERAIIELTNVPYHGIMDGGIGYVRLSKFSKDSGKELREAIVDLKNQGAKGMIFDLRSNGGGLLDQAVETANLFLEKERLIVYTQGRTEVKKEFYASDSPVYPDGPLVVLVNEGTASASEIVSGAIQDWDRGLIIGNTTFGKGLVQQIYGMPNDTYLKLTIAKYYVPSGRCIQKPERAKRQSAQEDPEDPEEMGEESEIVDAEEKEVFFTKGGRKVYGGGGIVPDLEIEQERLKPIEINLERQSMFFNFAVSYIAKHPEISRDFEVDDQILAEFKQFLKDKEFTYKSNLEMELEPLRERIEKEEKSEMFSQSLAELERLIEKDKEDDFQENTDYIKESLKRDILNNLYGQSAWYEEVLLKTDPYIQKAYQILTNQKEYKNLLKG
jgi:carboxyl-terminal processing protease